MAKRKGVYARDIDRLNLIFAAVAIGCMLSVFWMIWDDYAREWKRYQRQFQVIEQEVTQQEIDSEHSKLPLPRASTGSAFQALKLLKGGNQRLANAIMHLEGGPLPLLLMSPDCCCR